MRPLPIQPFAGAPPFVLGAAVVRGVATPVVDAAGLLGGPGGTPARFVTVRAGDRPVVLAVDEVVGVHAVTVRQGELPGLLASASDETIAALGTLDAELLVVLSAARLVEAIS